MTFMDAFRLWAIFLLAVALALLSIELGWWLGNRQRARRDEGQDARQRAGARAG